MPSLSLKASINYPFIGSSSGPVYPFPTTGLMGWYDSSPMHTSSILLNDGSGNPVSSGTNGAYVNTWQNLYTSGTAVMPDLQQPYGGSQPTYSASQKYGYNQATGTNHPGIVFPASSGATLDVGFNGDTFPNSVTSMTWFCAFPASTVGNVGNIFSLASQYRPNNRLNTITGNGLITGQCGNFDTGTINYGPFGGLLTTNPALAGYIGTDSDSNLYMASMAYIGSTWTEGARSGTTTFQGFSNTNGTSFDTSVVYIYPPGSPACPVILPWYGFHLSNGTITTDFPIGEFLIYNGAPSSADCKSIMNYLMTKWA